MKEQGRGTGSLVLRIVLIIIALLVLVNGIILLCETDPAKFYSTLFSKFTVSSTANPE